MKVKADLLLTLVVLLALVCHVGNISCCAFTSFTLFVIS